MAEVAIDMEYESVQLSEIEAGQFFKDGDENVFLKTEDGAVNLSDGSAIDAEEDAEFDVVASGNVITIKV